MNLYNRNLRMLIISNLSNSLNLTYETKPFLALNYNSLISKDDTPDFTEFDYDNAMFIPLDRIKITKNNDSGEIEIMGRKYSTLSSTQNFDSFDDIMDSGIVNDANIFYYLYLQKIIDLDTYRSITGNTKMNQASLILVHKKDNVAFKYSDFNGDINDEHGIALDNTYDIFPLSLDYMDVLDTELNATKYLNYEIVI